MSNEIKVLVVDDSAFARLAITRELQMGQGITVVGSARDGVEALEKVSQLHPDVITLDVEMPNIDGLETLKRIMSECPTPVVMLSSLTGSGTETTVRALEIGAVDFFLKRSSSNPIGETGDAIDLRTKLIMAAKIEVSKRNNVPHSALPTKKDKKSPKSQKAKTVLVIGSSTGGPRALYQVVPNLPADINAAVMIVQHMPPGFTDSFAKRLDQLSNISVKEAEPGDVLVEGSAFLAPGGYHLTVDSGGILGLNQNPPICNVRPSVNVTMESVAKAYGRAVLGVVLTGMGSDGTIGAGMIKKEGGTVIVEHRSTCVVWGMPRSVAESGYADREIPLPRIAQEIVKILSVKE
jgi:two-component system, chemotaxis family, protein-glutamate methylesterase/glutaminase